MSIKSQVVLATNNDDKVKEFQQLFAELDLNIVSQKQFKIKAVEESGLTFVENAILKARKASSQTGLSAIADDSGLEVDYLNGAPGIYSARFAGKDAGYKDNLNKLLKELEHVPMEKRTARFQCLLVYLRHSQDPVPVICQGTWEGCILLRPQGNNGFGYDPIFYLAERDCSAAQLRSEIKNSLSHRAQAARKLLRYFQEHGLGVKI